MSNAVKKYRATMLDSLWGDGRYHIDPRKAIELADAALAALGAAT